MKALTIGGAMIDTIAIIESDRIERMSMLNAESSFLLLEEGRKTEALEVSTHCGGGAANAAVALARLGFEVAALVKLGRDERADLILARFKQEGIDTRWVVPDARAPTGASVLVSSHERNAAVFTFRGANTLLEPGDLKEAAFAVDLVYVANLSNQSADCYPGIIAQAKAHGALDRRQSRRAPAFGAWCRHSTRICRHSISWRSTARKPTLSSRRWYRNSAKAVQRCHSLPASNRLASPCAASWAAASRWGCALSSAHYSSSGRVTCF